MRRWSNTNRINGTHHQHPPSNGGNGNGKGKPKPVAGSMDHENRENYEFGKYGYGKNHVKLLHVFREGPLHTIREFEVDTHLKLTTQKDYLDGNNQDIIATDTQKNTVYVLAKKHGIKTPEEFGLLICSHFLYMYRHVEEVEVNLEEYPWERLQADGQEHNHAFLFFSQCDQICNR
uniref:Uricase n=1 Tax=Photinus pyralis TaxID=7054 RepID=A0A1Y1N0J3_PHOPY